MNKILICFQPDAQFAAARRAHGLRNELSDSGAVFDIELLRVHAGDALSLAARSVDAIVAVGFGPDEFALFGQLSTPCLWDWGLTTLVQVDGWLACPASRQALKRSLAAAHGHVEITRDIALRLEDELVIGVSSHSVQRALAACAKRVIVIVGEGLGNMIYATGLIRWLAERLGAPVDLLIHNRFDTAVSLFASAQWINVVYPGFEYLAGRRYKLLINTVTAGKARPPMAADQSLWLDDRYSYNQEGRFMPEQVLNFLGLDKVFGYTPVWDDIAPLPFIRDVSDSYAHPGNKTLAVASGQKPGAWGKREWGGIPALVSRLVADGWDVRSFGLPGECVPGTKDYTGLPMRQVVVELAKCAYFVSHDGGLFHVADGIGVPSIGLFGPSSMVKNGPFYAHSRVLSSYRECSPCIYKIDWVRCTTPLCMQDLSVDHVQETLEALRRSIELNGYERLPFRLDEVALTHELGALNRPGPRATLTQYVDERLGTLPQSPEFFTQYVLNSLIAGDIIGAAANGEHMANRWPDDLAVRFFCSIIRQAHPGPTPTTDAKTALSPLCPEEMVALLGHLETRELNVSARGFLLRAGLRYWLQEDSKTGVIAFLTAAAKASKFSNGIVKPLFRYLDRFVPEYVQTVGVPKTAASSDLERMQFILRTPFEKRIDEQAQGLGALLNLATDDLQKTSMAPYFVNAQRIGQHAVELPMGEKTFQLVPGSTVLLLVPHVKIKDSLGGSTSGLIVQHARRLSALGMRAVVVTTGYGDVSEGLVLRDSVSYVQAHQSWGAAQWQAVFSYFVPTLCLSYANAMQTLDLPREIARKLIEVACDGLFDPHGVHHQFDRGNRWGCRNTIAVDKQDGHQRVSADQLSEAFFHRSEPPCDLLRPALSVLTIVHDPRDFVTLIQLMQAMPNVSFSVMSDFVYRGVEKNVSLMPLGAVTLSHLADADCLLQFSVKTGVLCAESIVFMEHGKSVVAATSLVATSPLAAYCFCVSEPQHLPSWKMALKAIVRNQNMHLTPMIV